MLYKTSGEIIERHLNQLCSMLTLTTGYYANYFNADYELGELAIEQELIQPYEGYIAKHLKKSVQTGKVSDILYLDYHDVLFYYHLYYKDIYKGSIFMGPMRLQDTTENKLYKDINTNKYINSLRTIYQSQLSSFMELIILVAESQRLLQMKEIDLHYKDLEAIEKLHFEPNKIIKHHSLYTEEKIFRDILTKDLDLITMLSKSFKNLILPPLADHPIRSQKNRVIVALTIITRSAIKLGMNSEEAFTASDSFIREVERLTTPTEIMHFQFNVLKYFKEKVNNQKEKSNYSPSTKLLLKHIEENLLDKSSFSDLCKKLDLNYKYASKKFSQDVGETFTKVRENKRLEKAANLLKYSEMTISDIAETTGFTYTYYFTKKFKNYYSITPSDYRKQHH